MTRKKQSYHEEQDVYHKESEFDEISTIGELNCLAKNNKLYEKLAKTAASNLGGPCDSLSHAMQYLRDCAGDTSEEGVVEEINFVRDCVKI